MWSSRKKARFYYSLVSSSTYQPTDSLGLNDILITPVMEPPCKEGCAYCLAGFYSLEEQRDGMCVYSTRLSTQEAKEAIVSRLQSIQYIQRYIKSMMTDKIDRFVLGWVCCGGARRADILGKVAWWLPRTPSIMTDYSLVPTSQSDRELIERRKRLLLPWLSSDMLRYNPHMLLALLKARADFDPWTWASFDNEQLEFGWTRGYLSARCTENWGCVIIHHSDHYGRIVDWNPDLTHKGLALGFPRADLILEAQYTLMSTLKDIVKEIEMGDTELPISLVSRYGGIYDNEDFNFYSLTGHISYDEPPRKSHRKLFQMDRSTYELLPLPWSPWLYPAFSTPRRFDVLHLIGVASLQVRCLEAFIYPLVANPCYMDGQLKLYVGEIDETTEEKKLARIFYFLIQIISVFWSFELWNEFMACCRDAHDLAISLNDRFYRPSGLMMREMEDKYARIERCLEQLTSFTKSSLSLELACSGNMAQCFSLGPAEGKQQKVCLNLKDEEEWKTKDPLLWYLVHIIVEPPGGDEFSFGKNVLFAAFDEFLTRSDGKTRARLSDFAQRWISHLVILSAISSSIGAHRPLIREPGYRPVQVMGARRSITQFTMNHPDQRWREVDPTVVYRYAKELSENFRRLTQWGHRSLKQLFQDVRSPVMDRIRLRIFNTIFATLNNPAITARFSPQLILACPAASAARTLINWSYANSTREYEGALYCALFRAFLRRLVGKNILLIDSNLDKRSTFTYLPCVGDSLKALNLEHRLAFRRLYQLPGEVISYYAEPRPIFWSTFISLMAHLGFYGQPVAGTAFIFYNRSLKFPLDGSAFPFMIHRPWPGEEIPQEEIFAIRRRMEQLYRAHGREAG